MNRVGIPAGKIQLAPTLQLGYISAVQPHNTSPVTCRRSLCTGLACLTTPKNRGGWTPSPLGKHTPTEALESVFDREQEVPTRFGRKHPIERHLASFWQRCEFCHSRRREKKQKTVGCTVFLQFLFPPAERVGVVVAHREHVFSCYSAKPVEEKGN